MKQKKRIKKNSLRSKHIRDIIWISQLDVHTFVYILTPTKARMGFTNDTTYSLLAHRFLYLCNVGIVGSLRWTRWTCDDGRNGACIVSVWITPVVSFVGRRACTGVLRRALLTARHAIMNFCFVFCFTSNLFLLVVYQCDTSVLCQIGVTAMNNDGFAVQWCFSKLNQMCSFLANLKFLQQYFSN